MSSPAPIGGCMIEEWQNIPNLTRYHASSKGRIKGPTGRVLKLKYMTQGYALFSIANGRGSSANVSVARSVCAAFNGRCPDGYEVDHINKIRSDDRPDNLRWVTKAENLAHRRHPRGQDHYNCKLSDADVRAIRCAQGSQRQIAVKYGVARETIRDIRSGKERRYA